MGDTSFTPEKFYRSNTPKARNSILKRQLITSENKDIENDPEICFKPQLKTFHSSSQSPSFKYFQSGSKSARIPKGAKNWSKIHKKEFSKMDDILTMSEKRKKRHKQLTGGKHVEFSLNTPTNENRKSLNRKQTPGPRLSTPKCVTPQPDKSSNKKKAFDLESSLKKKLNYKPHTGPVKPLGDKPIYVNKEKQESRKGLFKKKSQKEKKKSRRIKLQCAGKNVYFFPDRGMMNCQHHLNFSLGVEGHTSFLKSIQSQRWRTMEIRELAQQQIQFLQDNRLFVFCLVAENATAMQKAL